MGERFTNLVNDETTPEYTVVDADLRWNFGRLVDQEGAYLQLNVVNLFDEEYFSAAYEKAFFSGVQVEPSIRSFGMPASTALVMPPMASIRSM